MKQKIKTCSNATTSWFGKEIVVLCSYSKPETEEFFFLQQILTTPKSAVGMTRSVYLKNWTLCNTRSLSAMQQRFWSQKLKVLWLPRYLWEGYNKWKSICISKVQETRTGADIVCAIIVWKIWLDKHTLWSTVKGSIHWVIGIGGENIRNQWPDKEI